jgi:hypothetical protein
LLLLGTMLHKNAISIWLAFNQGNMANVCHHIRPQLRIHT